MTRINRTNQAKKPLTCIRPSYTIGGQNAGGETAEEIVIANFLNTLAEVSLSIIRRLNESETMEK
ncbi:MAG: hypothetical protein PHS35_04100 [Dehalococcoidales bacterium]|nr:hypothetical protein [Dehalococcoidales bacterium]MDD5605146.1 hypothetical protein [Dehalococcoidales bacterium]